MQRKGSMGLGFRTWKGLDSFRCGSAAICVSSSTVPNSVQLGCGCGPFCFLFKLLHKLQV